MKKISMLIVLLFFVCLFGCTSVIKKDLISKDGEIEKEWVEEGITKHFVFSRGIGAADDKMINKTQRKATSRNAAVVNAQYYMLSYVKGVQLEGGITVEKAMETDSNLTTKIDAVIKGATIEKTEWTSDDGCIVIMKLSKNQLKVLGLKVVD